MCDMEHASLMANVQYSVCLKDRINLKVAFTVIMVMMTGFVYHYTVEKKKQQSSFT